MDQVEHLTEDTQPKFFTRSTARHLRRKRLNEARRAEKQLLGFINVSDHSVGQQNQANKPDNGKAEVLTKSKARRLRKKAKLQENCNIPSCCNTAYYVYAPILDPGLYKYTATNEYDSVPYNKSSQNVTDLQFSTVLNLNSVKTLLSSTDQTEFSDPILAQNDNCSKSDCGTISNYKQKVDLGKISRSLVCDAKYEDSIDTGYEKRLKKIGRKSLNIESEEDSSDISRSSDSPFWLSNIEEHIRWEIKDESSVNSESSSIASKSENAQVCCANCDDNLDASEIRLSNSTGTLNDTAVSVNPLPAIDAGGNVQTDNTRPDFELNSTLTSLNKSNEHTSRATGLLLDEQETVEPQRNISITIENKVEQGNRGLSNNNSTTDLQFIRDTVGNTESVHCDNKESDFVVTEKKGTTDEPLIASPPRVQTEEILPVPKISTVKNTFNGTASGAQIIKKMSESMAKGLEKTREEIKAEREAKKAAKAAAKAKVKGAKVQSKDNTDQSSVISDVDKKSDGIDQTDTAHRGPVDILKITRESYQEACDYLEKPKLSSSVAKPDGESKAALRAERRAKQEAQRAAKQESLTGKVKSKTIDTESPGVPASVQVSPVTSDPVKKVLKTVITKKDTHEVNLFKHLYHERELALISVPAVNSKIHPAIVRLGVQYENKVIVGSNARCVALLAAVKQLIQDFERPSQADFIRGLETSLQESSAYLHHCRPLAVSMQNALRHLKWQMTQLPSSIADEEAKERLGNAIDTYILEQIQLAGKAISITIQTKISNGNVILTYGYSSLIHNILLDAHLAGKQFRVIVVDGRPWLEGKEQLRRLAKHGIECSYVLINALSYVMPEVSKVFLGAHAILANGAVMSRVGTAQVALMARAFNIPVLVACETHKSCERVQTDSIVYNELGDADELTRNFLSHTETSLLTKWRAKKYLNLLNITYDVTPADLVTAVVTELAILPCTSVPVILRIKPSEI